MRRSDLGAAPRRLAPAALVVFALASPASAQLLDRHDLNRLNRRLAGEIIDYTHNHGADRRVFSPILGMPRDLYVYLPPGYTPARSYPLILDLHMAAVDEHAFRRSDRIRDLDRLMACGAFPPAIVVAPDGTLSGSSRPRGPHSLFINGVGGRFQDHLWREVIPFVLSRYSIRPERRAHAILGASAGGFGGLNLALKHRAFFGSIATLAAPANLRYDNVRHDPFAPFDPASYRWKTIYDPDEVVGRFYVGLVPVRARKYIAPVFGDGPEVAGKIARENPADLIFTTDLRPGQLAIYLDCGGRDNWNFDAQAESFAWLAASRGVAVTTGRAPRGRHNLRYFRDGHDRAFAWLARQLLPPSP